MRVRALIGAFIILCITVCGYSIEMSSIPTAEGGRLASATIETSQYRVVIRFDQGGKIGEFLNKSNGTNGVAWGESAGSGFFDDRHVFSAMEYKTGKVIQTENRITIPCTIRSDSGIELRKTFIFDEKSNFFRVSYEIFNHGYLPYSHWIKCLGVPCGGEIEKDDVSISFVTEGKVQKFSPWPHNYYPETSGGWMALLRASKKAGYFVVAEPQYLEKFYFWSGSKVAPTFEWIYKTLQPGHSFKTTVLCGLLNNVEKVEWITPQGALTKSPAKLPVVSEAKYAKIPQWKDLEELYKPTNEEKKQGFIPTVLSSTTPRMRLTSVEADVGRNEGELIPIELFAVEEIKNIHLELSKNIANDKTLQCEAELDYRLIPGGKISSIPAGSYGRLWLRVLPTDKARTIKGTIAIVSDKGRRELPLTIVVWPIDFPAKAMLPLNPFVGPFSMGMISYLEGKDTETFPLFLDVMQKIGMKSVQISFSSNRTLLYKLTKEKKTGLYIYDYLAKHGPITIETLPDLNFSEFDPAIKILKERGMTHIEFQTGMAGIAGGWQQWDSFARSAFKRPFADEEEGWKVQMWAASQFRDYLHSRGITDLWAKISDEIAADKIPAWLNAAKRWRAIGYKTFTTNSIGIPRSVEHLAQMNTGSDGWMIQTSFSRDFFDRTRRGSALTPMKSELAPPTWSKYSNGGALNTWVVPRGFKPFPEGVDPIKVEDFAITADGKPLDFKHGRSPWGNTKENIAFRSGNSIYVSLAGGASPKDTKFEITWKVHSTTAGKPAVQLEHADEQWYYGGGYFTTGYLDTRKSTWLGSLFQLHGRGHYVVYHWLPERRLFWYEKGKPIVFSPAYEGLRDSEEDSAYYRTLVAKGASQEVLDSIVGFSEKAAVPFAERRSEFMAWDDVAETVTYHDFNLAKRRMLEALQKIEKQ
ncbi:MAG: hypothetical protein WDA18_05210 [Candidatus Ratteibacteria bacterium]